MSAFRLLLRSFHCVGLYIQLSGSLSSSAQVENRISSNALFTEVPHDMTAHSGQDVEMACSFRGSGSTSYSLEIQWWYIRNHKEWTDKETWTTNQVVKVAGSNISHKLRLSSVKPSDEGTYECRVIDFSDSRPRHHRVRAYLQVEGDGSAAAPPHHRGEAESQKHQPTAHHGHKSGRELRKRAADDTNTDCTESCAL
ncbi:V-set and transmembrane domain-containing protein 2-like protein isoform X2 [Tachysurus vachellii]|uniref:V-set and transmembrane domain-containing protein 2-like protein isoform X2 n=1 Tax=Tachysurus vachellii TaxID=175792 RepID=UPI00296B1195|nr:V-set and transmembrane domain-containing protein 2-like protein isoform X2 [Tachysurus vachellii]